MVWDPAEEDLREALEPVYYDVPAHLKWDLWDWTNDHLHKRTQGHGSDPIDIVLNALRIDVPMNPRGSNFRYEHIRQQCANDAQFQLRVVRVLLKDCFNESKAGELERRLKRANSGYAVNMAMNGLEFRVLPAVREEIEHAIETAPETVGQLLTKAWNAAYGVDPRPDDAFQAAYQAAEAALRPVITPDDGNASLNKQIDIYDAKPSKWELVVKDSRPTFDPKKHTELDGALAVMAMARTISYGQRARHGQDEDANTVQESRTAVHFAIAIAMCVHERAFRSVVEP